MKEINANTEDTHPSEKLAEYVDHSKGILSEIPWAVRWDSFEDKNELELLYMMTVLKERNMPKKKGVLFNY